MPIEIRTLRSAAGRYREPLSKSLQEANVLGQKTAFLCHSHSDVELVKGVVALLNESGWKLYIDWADVTMPPTPTRETARKIKDKISTTTYFLFLATANSTSSRWCPWEIGYADGVKNIDQIFIIPTRDDAGRFHGNEYLQLYRKIDIANQGGLATWQPLQENGVYLRNL